MRIYENIYFNGMDNKNTRVTDYNVIKFTLNTIIIVKSLL